jgi:hypothetical protein
VSELLDVRVIGTPQTTTEAVSRLPELFEVDRQHGPYPSRKTPGQVRYYLTGRLRPPAATVPLAEIEDLKAARDLDGELAAITGHWAQMQAQPWWPPKVGDVAIGHPDPDDSDPYGVTFLAVAWPAPVVRSASGWSPAPRPTTPPRGGYAIEDLWFEWPAISVVRAGTVYPSTRRGVAS